MALFIAVAAGGGDFSTWVIPGLMVRNGAAGSISALVLATLGFGLTVLGRVRAPGYFGFRLPNGWGFLVAIPLAVVFAVVGGVWWPMEAAPVRGVRALLMMTAGVAGFELLARGWLHGSLVKVYPVMLPGGRHFISVPNGVAALFSAGATMACFAPTHLPLPAMTGLATLALWALACLLMGLLCGGVRERWGSVWASVTVHCTAALVAWLVVDRLF